MLSLVRMVWYTRPIGDAHMGENQFLKMMRDGRKSKLGMIRPTLELRTLLSKSQARLRKGKRQNETAHISTSAYSKKKMGVVITTSPLYLYSEMEVR